MALGWKNITVARTDCGADVFGLAGFLRDDDLICHDGPLGDVFNAVPLLEHIMNERDMQVKLSGASLGRFGYAPKGMMKRLRCHSNRAPDRRTHRLPWNYRGEAPERVPTFQRGHIFPRRLLRQCGPAQMRGRSFYLRNPDNRIL